MIFPRPYVILESGCIVLVGRGSSGPITHCRPRLQYDGEEWYGHRLSYHLNVAPIPRCPETLKEGIVCHHCDQGWCINPDHLYLGTSKQNRVDMYARHPTIKKTRSAQFKDIPLSPEHAAKIAAALKGQPLTDDRKAKISAAMMGRPAWNKGKSNWWMKGKPAWNKGIPHSEEHRAKISAGLRQRKGPPK